MLVGEGLCKSGQSFNNPLRRSFLIAGLICIRFADRVVLALSVYLCCSFSLTVAFVFVKVSLAFQSLSLFLAAPRSQFCHFLFLIFVSLSLLIFIGDNRRGEILNKTDLSSDGFFSAEGLEFGSRRMAEESFPAAVRDKSLKWLHLHLQIQSADWQRVFRHTGARRRQLRLSVLHVTTGAQQSHRVQRKWYYTQ